MIILTVFHLIYHYLQCFETNEKSILRFLFFENRSKLGKKLIYSATTKTIRNVLKRIFEFMNFFCAMFSF